MIHKKQSKTNKKTTKLTLIYYHHLKGKMQNTYFNSVSSMCLAMLNAFLSFGMLFCIINQEMSAKRVLSV